MIDTEFEKRGRAMSNELNQIIDLEYTWGDFPAVTAEQIYNRYDVARETAQLRARIAELERERDELQKLPFTHSRPEDCPCWYDYCHCNVDTLRDQIKRAEQAEREQLRAELEQANIEFAALTNIVNTHMMLSHDGAACMLCGTIFYSKDRQSMADYCFTHTVLCAANVLTPIERKIIHELRSERDALRLSLNTTNVIVNDQIGKIADLIKERDAAIADARELAGLAAYAYRVGAGVFFTSDEREKVKKYVGAGVFFTADEREQIKKYLVAKK